MKLIHKAIAWLILILILGLSSCSKTDTYTPPKEGDIVTWKWTPQLVFKARLGQRRIHIPDTHCTRCEREFHKPQYDRFLGQFPIDYVPERFEKLTATEIENLPPTRSNTGAIEFSLMLNGTKCVGAESARELNEKLDNGTLNGDSCVLTDRSFLSDQTLDDINQVKVHIQSQGIQDDVNFTTKDGQERFLKSGKGRYDKQLSEKYGLSCYYQMGLSLEYFSCFGHSSYSHVSGINISSNFANNFIDGYSYEPIYGGIHLRWRIHRENLKHWQEVDAAIWRLLESWNVAPFDAEN